MTLSKGPRSAVAAICGAVVLAVGFLMGGPQAIADPLTDAQHQLDQLKEQASAIEQQYNDSQQRLQAAQQQQAQLTTQIQDQQAQLDAMKPAIAWIATMQNQGGGVGMTANFLLSDSPDQFLQQMGTTASVNALIEEKVARYVSQKDALDALNTSLAATVATIQTESQQQQQLLADAKAKQDAQQKVVNKLTAQQRAALAARQASAASLAAGTGAASGRAQAVVNYALAQVGKPYRMGGAGPDAFDCSGLAMAAYRTIGISLPHSASAQAGFGTPVSLADLAPGDLLFFYSPIHHVGIYIGNGQMVHASTPASGVKVSGIEAPFVGARRLA